MISIHVPHTRDDLVFLLTSFWHIDFNPRPSHEGRLDITWDDPGSDIFQSTSLTRGTTHEHCAWHWSGIYFNPRPSHEGRLLIPRWSNQKIKFQSTSLTRGTTLIPRWSNQKIKFQSTSLTRGTTWERNNHVPVHFQFQSTSLTRGTTSSFLLP